MKKEEILKVLGNRRLQWGIVIIVLLTAFLWGASIRLSNWNLLTDQTTGEKIPLALDPFYFLRISEEIIENNGSLPDADLMRYPSASVEYNLEILPDVIVLMFRAANILGDYTLREVNIFSPVVFYFVGIIFFFLLCYALTKSKFTSLISSIFLAFVPSYLYRTLAGFSDHDALGMAAFFIAALSFFVALSKVDKEKKILPIILWGLLAAFFSTLAVVSWGGIANFVFMIFPLSFLLLWLFRIRKGRGTLKYGIIFYSTWGTFTALFGIFFSYSPIVIFNRFFLSSSGLISLFVFGFIILDYVAIRYLGCMKFINDKNREASVLGLIIVLGIIGLPLVGRNIFELVGEIWIKLFHPWGIARVGLTVAENAQPYLLDWISSSGKPLFWMFVGGMVLFGLEVIEKISDKKRKILAGFFWVLMLSSILFSRISASSIMNGTNFFSQVFYLGGLLAFAIFFIWLYYKEKEFELNVPQVFLFSWMFFTLISARAAQRLFFAITPLVCFFAGYLFLRIWGYIKNSEKGIFKTALIILFVLLALLGAHSVYNFEESISYQAAATGPSANYQWQNAMAWVRENTPHGSIFVHWWDYGYWVEYLGERPAVTDGGHAVSFWDHLIGRYILTTPSPETAYSFMKTHNVSYLLIDPTDLGKYGAYSKIGSDGSEVDRFSSVPILIIDPAQTTEASNRTIDVYLGGPSLDEDILYSVEGKEYLLPAQKAGLGGILWRESTVEGVDKIEQPIGAYFYNNQRYDLPIRYLYYNNELMDFGNGLEAVIRAIPYFDGSQLNDRGALIYLSPKVSKGLFARLYLLDDAFNDYEGLNLVHSEDDIVVSSLRSQGAPLDDFIFYQGFRGPIKIWEVNYPENTLEREEFLRKKGDWAEFDNLEFVR